LTEAATRICDRSDPVSDEVWAEAARHYDEKALASLVLSIAQINVWNRLNVTTRQVAGTDWKGQKKYRVPCRSSSRPIVVTIGEAGSNRFLHPTRREGT